MQFFVSYDIMRKEAVLDCGYTVIEVATPADILASVEAIKNDAVAATGSYIRPEDKIRALCFTALPSA